MGNSEVKLMWGETAYCGLVLVSVIGGMMPLPNDISAFLGLLVFLLFPIGIVMELFYRRWPIPMPVLLCFGLTTVWTILVIKSNLR